MYYYKATVTKVYDGDTITVNIDLGFSQFFNDQVLRLYGVNTPELRGSEREKKAGQEARDFVRERILGKEIVVHTYKDKKGKYGRYLATVFYKREGDKPSDPNINLNDELIANGHGVPYFGGKR